jgi:hypothetical protein
MGAPRIQLSWLILLGTVTSVVGDEPTTIRLNPGFLKGELGRYEVSERRDESDSYTATRENKHHRFPTITETSSIWHVRVLETNPLVVQVELRDIRSTSDLINSHPFVQRITRLMIGVPYRLELSPSGSINRLVNWESVGDKIEELLAALERELHRAGQSEVLDDLLARTRARFKEAYSDPDRAKMLVLQQVGVLFAAFTSPFSTEVQVEDVEFSSPLAPDQTILARRKVRLVDYVPESPEVKVSAIAEYDPDSMGDATEKLIEGITSRPTLFPHGMPRMVMSERCECVFHRQTGWLLEARITQKMKMQGRSFTREQLWRRLQPVEKRKVTE